MIHGNTAIRIFLLGAIGLYRDGVRLFLDHQARFQLEGTTGNVAQGLRDIRDRAPDVVLLDHLLADRVNLVREIRDRSPTSRVVALAVPELDEVIRPYARAGVKGFVMHDDSLHDLARIVQAVAKGESPCSNRVTAAILDECESRERSDDVRLDHHVLSKREREILKLLAQDLSNKEISGALNISVSTVKNHAHHIYDKLGVAGRGSAVGWLHEQRTVQALELRLT